MRAAWRRPRRFRRRELSPGPFTTAGAITIGLAVFALAILVIGRAAARLHIDSLWFDALGHGDVMWTTLRTKVGLFLAFFVVFAVVAGVNLLVVDRVAPEALPAHAHPLVERVHDVVGQQLRTYRWLVTVVFGTVLALPATAQWQAWLLYRNGGSFRRADARFGVDVGFYVFELPFVAFVIDWLFIAIAVVVVMVAAAHLFAGSVTIAGPTPTIGVSMRYHLAVLLALLAVVKAGDYWIRRYELTSERSGFVRGPTYVVVNAEMPAYLLLGVVALLTAAAYLAVLRGFSWRTPLIASGVWLVLAIVAGYVYPAVIQSLVVRPNQKSREAPFIEANVHATREAMGLTNLQVSRTTISFDAIDGDDLGDDLTPLENVRLIDPVGARSRFVLSEGRETSLTIDDLDVDRYDLEGDGGRGVEQVLIGAKELDVDNLPNRGWQGRHLLYTHGCGMVMAPASRVDQSGEPLFITADLERNELYFSPSLTGWAVAGTSVEERSCAADGGTESDDSAGGGYGGTAAVELGSWWTRASFALAFLDHNVLGSGEIDEGAQMLWVRNVRDRVEKLAPFLSFDGDPYPVVLPGEEGAGGRAVWVIDGYTSTSRYPNAEAVGNDIVLSADSGISRSANYVRNSVKAVVDAYDGSVTFYLVDTTDPIVAAWDRTFPELFTGADEMPAGLQEHLRYPEDLFRVQTSVYSKYHLDPEQFFDRRGAWSVAQSPGYAPRDLTLVEPEPAPRSAAGDEATAADDLATELSANRFVPYYTMFADPVGDHQPEFVLFRPFVPFSSDDSDTVLQAFMTASSDGRLLVYVVDDDLPAGPSTVATTMESEPAVAEQVLNSNQARGGTSVRFGDLQMVPIAGGLMWVRPFLVAAQLESGPIRQVIDYEFVIVEYGGRAAIATTLGGAIGDLFPGADIDLGERVGVQPGGAVELPPNVDAGLPEGDMVDSSDTAVLLEINDLLAEADEALRNGDLARYQELVDAARELIADHLGIEIDAAPPVSSP